MANAPQSPKEPIDDQSETTTREPYSNPVDATYSNPKQSYPDEILAKPEVPKENVPKQSGPPEDGFKTAADPVDASYAPSTYASFSKVQPTENIPNQEKPARHASPSAHAAPTHARSTATERLNPEHQHGLHSSMVAWSAIFAGTLISASIALILVFLGTAMGLASISPWAHMGVSAQTFSFGAAIVLIIMQCVSSGLGGYLTGRLRSKWINMMPDEVFFRDTAHGFLSWALATLLTAGLLASATSSAINTGATAAAITANRTISDNAENYSVTPEFYFVDRLFRADHLNATEHNMRAEANGILVNALANHNLSETDRAYLAQLVSWHTGLANGDAMLRVRDILAQIDATDTAIRQNADIARKAASSIALFTFLSLLMGAFVASVGAALGGHHRDKI